MRAYTASFPSVPESTTVVLGNGEAHALLDALDAAWPLVDEASDMGRLLREHAFSLMSLTATLRTSLRQKEPEWQASVPGDDRLPAAHEAIVAAPRERRPEMAARASRSYSVPGSCCRREGCRIEDGYVVWPDGERWPVRLPANKVSR